MARGIWMRHGTLLRRTLFLAVISLGASLAGCGSDATLDRTAATVEPVRGEARIADVAIRGPGRAAAAQVVSVGERGLARLALDSGPHLLLDEGATVELVDDATLRLTAGRAYAEADEGEELFVETEAGSLRVSDAAISARGGDALEVYVVRGEVSWRAGDARGIARAGEQLSLHGDGDAAEPVTLWHDWTGGLAQPGPADARGPEGVGVLEARVPDEIGQARWPLVIRRLDVQVHIVGDLAVTEVEQVFFNPASETVEGLYRVRVPEESVLQRFAVDRSGRLVDGYVREKAQARQAYEAQVYRGSTLDPALLEWVAPGRYQARIYPIHPGETRRIVIRYAEWLGSRGEEGPRLYRFSMAAGRRAPRIQELSISVDLDEAGAERVRAGMGAAIEEGRVRLRRSDFAPRSDFWLELIGGDRSQHAWRAPHEPPPRAPDAREVIGEADERDYWYVPLHLPEALFADAEAEGIDLVIVADVSAATDRAHLELGRSVAEALTAHLGADDRVAVVTSDLTIRALGGTEAALGGVEPARLEALLDGLARAPAGGATDLGAAISAAAELLDPARPGAVVYVGDGAPTVGELEADGLLERIARLPTPLRLYAIGVGSDANLELLEAVTRGGGLALRVEERSAAADAALRVLEHASRPVAQRVTVDVGTGIENVYPRRPVDVVRGEVLPVVGRIREAAPTSVIVRGTIGGEEFEETIALTTVETEQSTDLRLRWAGERLRQLLLEGAGREEVAELGTRYGLITPFTSYYVPSAQELGQIGAAALPWIDRPSLLAQVDGARRNPWMDGVFMVALGPFGLAGCASGGDEASVSSAMEEEAPGWLQEPAASEADMGGQGQLARDEEGAMGEETGASRNRYGIEGPTDNAAPAPSRAMLDPSAGAQLGPQGQPTPTMPTEAPPADFADQLQGLAGAGGGGGSGSGYGAGGGGRGSDVADGWDRAPGAAQPATTASARPSEPEPEPMREMRRAAPRPRSGGTVGGGAIFGNQPSAGDERNSRALLGRSAAHATAVDETVVERSVEQAFYAEGEQTRPDTNTVIRIVTMELPRMNAQQHTRRRCSDASDLPLSEREGLWGERLGQGNGASAWISTYRDAARDCELEDWRDRRAMLSLILGRAGSIERMVDVYRLFDSASARAFLRAAILRRVRSPQDLRAIRAAFGLGLDPDWELVEQILERANGPEARIRALRRLAMQYPDSFDLKLRLLEGLEVGEHGAEARRLADQLRVDPRSDAGVRTAVGEMFLRMDMEDEARRVFSEIVEFAPLDELARRRLGDLYRAHGWFEDAYRQYQTLASIRPDDPSALLLLAQAAAGTGRIDEALRLEQRLMETAQPGAERGIARVAQLWTSVRLAKLRDAARSSNNEERLDALERRMRRSGVLTGAGDLRVTLVWSHPDAQIAMWTAHPGQSLARPDEITPEHGIEVFEVPEEEDGAYSIEVRRSDASSPTALEAELVVLYHEGRDDEVIRIVPLHFSDGRDRYAWSIRGNELAEAR